MTYVSPTFTYGTRISPDPLLVDIARVCGKAERDLHRHLASGGSLDQETKKRVMGETGLPGRYYNGITTTLQGKHDAVTEQRKLQIIELAERIKHVEKKIEKLGEDADEIAADPKAKNAAKRIWKILRAVHGKARKLERLRLRKERFETGLGNDVPTLCFGSKKLFRKQFHLEGNGYASHEEWLRDWRAARDSQFLLVGSQDEVSGNKTCLSTVAEDGSVSLRILVPERLRRDGQKHVVLTGLRFGWGHAEIVGAISAANATRVGVAAYQAETKKLVSALPPDDGSETKKLRTERRLEAKAARNGPSTALTWRFVHDVTGWTAFVSLSRRLDVRDWNFDHGAIGVDLNVGFVSIMPADGSGNPLPSKSLEVAIETAALSSDRAKAVMGEAVKRIVEMALAQNRPIVIENLDFVKKKAALKENAGRGLRRKLSSFSYNLFKAMLHSRAARFGVRVVEVNPAYTSHMGRAKYARPLGISVHRAAAAMIARRGMGLSEGLSSSAELPLGDGRHVALHPPARMGRRHVWASWGKHFGRYKAARKALDAAVRKSRDGIAIEDRSGRARKVARAADPARQGWRPAAMAGEIRHVAPTAALGTAAAR